MGSTWETNINRFAALYLFHPHIRRLLMVNKSESSWFTLELASSIVEYQPRHDTVDVVPEFKRLLLPLSHLLTECLIFVAGLSFLK